MSILSDFVAQVHEANEAGVGLTLTAEQIAQLAKELAPIEEQAWTDEDIANMSYDELFNTGKSIKLGEVDKLPEYGAWADWDLGDSAEFISNIRRKNRTTW